MELSQHLLKISDKYKHDIQKCLGDLPEAILMIDLLSLKADFSSLEDHMNLKKYLNSDNPLKLRWYLQSILPNNLEEIISNKKEINEINKQEILNINKQEILNINKLINKNSSLYYILPEDLDCYETEEIINTVMNYKNKFSGSDYTIYNNWLSTVREFQYSAGKRGKRKKQLQLVLEAGFNDIYQNNEKIYNILHSIIGDDIEFTIDDLNNFIPQINLINYEYRIELYNKYMKNDKTFAEFTETWLKKNWLESKIGNEKDIINLQSSVIKMINNKINSSESLLNSKNNYMKYCQFVEQILTFIRKFKDAETIEKLLYSISDVYKLKLV